jgi:flagellar motor protein MotB
MGNWKHFAPLGCVSAALLAGCQSGPWPSFAALTPWKNSSQVAQSQQLELARHNREQQAKLNSLNTTNEQLYKLLAETQQDASLHKAENDALRDQLRGVTAQLQGMQTQTADNQRKFDNLLASVRRRGGAIIEPNNSLRDSLPVITVPGVEVRREGEQVRVDILAGQLFAPDDAQLTASGTKLLEAVVDELDRRYPGHRIGIEAHTDSEPLRSPRWGTHHQLTLAQANTVFNHLVSHTRLRAEQLTVGGHGATRPFASNANPAGRQRNRRLELVVYPERVGN